MGNKIDVIAVNVNSKLLFKEINGFVSDGLMNLGIIWSNAAQRGALIEIVEDWLNGFVEKGKIKRFDVICDERNNPTMTSVDDKFNLTVKYDQIHCLNTTKIEYKIANTADNIDDLIQYYINP